MFRLFILIGWTFVIFLFTCTISMELLIKQGMISFQWDPQPNINQFWYPLPSAPDSSFIIRKMGHALSFLTFSILLFSLTLSKKKMIGISLFYAVVTELLQLFFHRGGRLFDIVFDGSGILIALIILSKVKVTDEKSLTGNSQT